jgi:hypothetical protein
MQVADLKANDKVSITHSRKGTFDCEILNTDLGEWLDVILLEKVTGLVNEWLPGEELRVRKSFITNIKPLSES